MKTKLPNSQGFTLVELLVVIAVLGVLATVLLVAVNPLEQLARGRDSGRVSSVTQLGRAMSAYVTNNNATISVINGGSSSGTWQTSTIIASKDIANAVTVILPGTAAFPAGSPTLDSQTGVGYEVDNATPTKYAIWTYLESNSELVKAGNGTPCAVSKGIVYFDSATGKTQVGCTAAANSDPYSGLATGPYNP